MPECGLHPFIPPQILTWIRNTAAGAAGGGTGAGAEVGEPGETGGGAGGRGRRWWNRRNRRWRRRQRRIGRRRNRRHRHGRKRGYWRNGRERGHWGNGRRWRRGSARRARSALRESEFHAAARNRAAISGVGLDEPAGALCAGSRNGRFSD